MRVLIWAAAAILVITGSAMANDNVKGARHQHYRNANASIAESPAPVSSGPVGNPGAHDVYMKNLRDSGYNPASNFDAAGNVKQN